MWIYLGIASCVFLCFYDVSKKHALKGNAVLAVLFFSTCPGAALRLPEILLSALAPAKAQQWRLYVPLLGWRDHLHSFIKAFIVATSWVFVYFRALEYPGALIVLLSAIRRSNVIISFSVGSLVFKEVNIPHKALALAGVLAGVLCIVMSAR
jgi:hypothetical protein